MKVKICVRVVLGLCVAAVAVAAEPGISEKLLPLFDGKVVKLEGNNSDLLVEMSRYLSQHDVKQTSDEHIKKSLNEVARSHSGLTKNELDIGTQATADYILSIDGKKPVKLLITDVKTALGDARKFADEEAFKDWMDPDRAPKPCADCGKKVEPVLPQVDQQEKDVEKVLKKVQDGGIVLCSELKSGDPRRQEIGRKCRTGTGSEWERVARTGWREAWLAPDKKTIWSHRLAGKFDNRGRDENGIVVNSPAANACKKLGNGARLPERKDYEAAAADHVYDLFQNNEDHDVFWSSSVGAPVQSDSAYYFDGDDGSIRIGNRGTDGGISVRCVVTH